MARKVIGLKVTGSKGFTLVELLVVIVIIGVLSAVAVPLYTRHITNAKAQEAIQGISSLLQYAQSYIRSHPDNAFSSGSMLLQDALSSNTGNWVNEIIGGDSNHYFTYRYTRLADTCYITALGNPVELGAPADTPFANNEWIRVLFGDEGQIFYWEATGKLQDIKP